MKSSKSTCWFLKTETKAFIFFFNVMRHVLKNVNQLDFALFIATLKVLLQA